MAKIASRTTKLATGLTAAAVVAATQLALGPTAAADPALPLDPGQLPGLEAVQNLSPVVQQAAANPASAQQLLLAAASQLAGNATTRPVRPRWPIRWRSSYRRVGRRGRRSAPRCGTNPGNGGRRTRNNAPADPGSGNGPIPLPQHLPEQGVVAGTDAHLPIGINPENAVGPAAAAMPEVPTPVTSPAATTATPMANPVPAPAPSPAPDAAPKFDPNSPPTQDFMYPSISNGCLKDGGNVIATALSVAVRPRFRLPARVRGKPHMYSPPSAPGSCR